MTHHASVLIDRFIPAPGFSNAHLQTLTPLLTGRLMKEDYTRQELTLEDGDFVDLDWTAIPERGNTRPIIILFHGLEGDSHSHYCKSFMRAIHAAGWYGVVMNFRCCSGRLNRQPRLYHSGETGDGGYFIKYLSQQFPLAPLFATGFSLGGNMLLKMAGEQGSRLALKALVSISAPVKLAESTRYMMKGLPRFYQAYLLRALKRKVLDKYPFHDYQSLIDVSRSDVQKCNTIREFDHIITARLHGFDSADDYYQKSSAFSYVQTITKPCLIIHAEDDPIAPSTMLSDLNISQQAVVLEMTERGGHVGYMAGAVFKPRYWLADRVVAYFKQLLETNASNVP